MVFTVVWMLNEYQGVITTYRKEFEDINEAEKFMNHLNSLNSGCDQYEVGLFEGRFISRCKDSFELEEDR